MEMLRRLVLALGLALLCLLFKFSRIYYLFWCFLMFSYAFLSQHNIVGTLVFLYSYLVTENVRF